MSIYLKFYSIDQIVIIIIRYYKLITISTEIHNNTSLGHTKQLNSIYCIMTAHLNCGCSLQLVIVALMFTDLVCAQSLSIFIFQKAPCKILLYFILVFYKLITISN